MSDDEDEDIRECDKGPLSFEEEFQNSTLVEEKKNEFVIEEEQLLEKMQVEEQHPGITVKNVLVMIDKFNLPIDCVCDAPFPGGPLTTRQPAEYSWMSGNPIPLTKIGQSFFCTGSSTQGTTYPKFSQRPHQVHIQFKMSKIGHLGPCINTHKITYQLYTNSSRVDTSLLIQTYIKIYNSNTCYTK